MPVEPNYDEQDFSAAAKFVHERQTWQRRPKKVSDILGRLLARKGYAQQISTSEVQTVWQNLIPLQWQEQTQVGNLNRGTLEIVVTSTVLRQRLEFERQNLLKQIQQQLPQNKIKEIRFRIGNFNG